MNQDTKYGLLGYHDLIDWYNSTFDKNEKSTIKSFYRPMGGTYEGLISGTLQYTNTSNVSLLYIIARYLIRQPQHSSIISALLNKAEQLVGASTKPSDRHFLYLTFIQLYDFQKNRDQVRLYAKKCVDIAEDVSAEFKRQYGKNKISHQGYIDLIEILIEEQDYVLALMYSEQAIKQEWTGPWNLFIQNIEKHCT